MDTSLHCIGVQSGIGAKDQGCKDGPQILFESDAFRDLHVPKTLLKNILVHSDKRRLEALNDIAAYCTELGNITQSLTKQKKSFCVIGGDHSCAIGTWSGVASALQSPIGLLWIDAHLDSHTFQTSESGNIHGMPVASLLGHGEKPLTHLLSQHPKVDPRFLVFIGTRSYESGEFALIQKLGVKIFFMKDIEAQGLKKIMSDALAIVRQAPNGYGVSFDLDAIDPLDAPGVGTPEKNGIHQEEFLSVIHACANDPKLLGIEIAEFNPHHDVDDKTKLLICNTLKSLYGNTK